MKTDIIAESETERMVNLLMNGEADQKSQQIAIASMLIALTKLSDEVREIKQSLWRPEDLDKEIDERHKRACADCPARKLAERHAAVPPPPARPELKWWSFLTSESFRYFLLILMFAWALVVVTSGRENAQAVQDHLKSTLTGGLPVPGGS